MKILTFKETSIIINKFRFLGDESNRNSVLSSELVYKNSFDVGFGTCDISVFNYDGDLFIRTIIEDDETLEPLLIQVEDDGTILDFILLDFVIRFGKYYNLESYYILPSDYTFIMERVRF